MADRTREERESSRSERKERYSAPPPSYPPSPSLSSSSDRWCVVTTLVRDDVCHCTRVLVAMTEACVSNAQPPEGGRARGSERRGSGKRGIYYTKLLYPTFTLRLCAIPTIPRQIPPSRVIDQPPSTPSGFFAFLCACIFVIPKIPHLNFLSIIIIIRILNLCNLSVAKLGH